jgi:predicted Fe-S protein YdhL (DUF1289 family)
MYSPHRSRWQEYSSQEKRKLLDDHASTVFEDYCRQQFSDAARYWEANVAFDLVRTDPGDGTGRGLVVSEVKWRHLTDAERLRIRKQLEEKWKRSTLCRRYPTATFEVLDAGILASSREPRSRRRASQRGPR